MKLPSTLVDLLISAVLVLTLAATAVGVPAAEPAPADPATLDYHLQARSLAPGVWVVEGQNADFSVANGCNIINTGFIATGAGVVVINTGTSRLYGEQLRALIRRTTPEPVVRVLQLNLHPDYFMGHQAFADLPRYATPATAAGVGREASAYEANLFRLCGDWMRGTEALAPDREIQASATPSRWQLGEHSFEWLELKGHTDSDLVLIDRTSGVAFVGGLVFSKRVPTTPHARVGDWLASLDRLEQMGLTTVVPSHGPVYSDGSGLAQTRRFLRWLDDHFQQAASQGLDMNELLRAPVPAEFRQWAAFDTEYVRNVAHLYPVYERAALAPGRR